MLLPTPDARATPNAEVRKLFAALQTDSDVFGPYHPRTLAIVHSLAIALWQCGNIPGAIDLLTQARDQLKPALGEAHPARVEMLHTLGQIAFEQGQLEEAARIFREVLEGDIRHAGANNPKSLEAKGDLAAVLFELGHNEEAETLEREACQSARQISGRLIRLRQSCHGIGRLASNAAEIWIPQGIFSSMNCLGCCWRIPVAWIRVRM